MRRPCVHRVGTGDWLLQLWMADGGVEGDPLLRSVWDGTTMVGYSTLVREDVGGSSEIAYCKLSGHLVVGLNDQCSK
jgi:hypothetical protein